MAEIDAANRTFQAAEDQARDAEASLRDARAALPALLQKALEGGVVTDTALITAHRRILDAEHVVEFRKEIARRLAPSAVEADARLSTARAQAFDAVLQRADRFAD